MKNDERRMKNEERKKGSVFTAALFSLLFSLLLLAGCDNPALTNNGAGVPEGKGTFSLSLSTAGRTILPQTPDVSAFAAYTLAFTPTSGGTASSVDKTNADIENAITLDAGTYSLTVNAYLDTAKAQLAASGTETGIVITSGGATVRTVTLATLDSGGTGTFRWNITLPTGVTTANLVISPDDGTSGIAEQTVTLSGTAATGERTLNSGAYNLTFNLVKGGGSVVWKELLYVHRNLESVHEFEFTDAHFINPNYTVTFNGNGGTGGGPVSVLHGATVSAPAITRPGSSFEGWFTDDGTFLNSYDFTKPVIESFALFAKWTIRFEYVITRSGTTFTAARGGTTILNGTGAIQPVINAIRANAAGQDVIIQFGDGATALNIDAAAADFNNTGGTWGAVTLEGAVTSSNSSATSGTVVISNPVAVTSRANIANTAASANGRAVYHNSTGAFTVSGGTIAAATGVAVFNANTGIVTVGGGTVTSENVTATSGTIFLANNGAATANRLVISGGAVENAATGTAVNAVYNAGAGGVLVSGGAITSPAFAVQNANPAANITLSGGPDIGGRIRPSAAGMFSVSSFTPGARTYTLDFAVYNEGAVAVVGSVTASSFALHTISFSLTASGGNLTLTESPYIITRTENVNPVFTAMKGGTQIGTPAITFQTVLNAIRADANGLDATIRFGNGTDYLDIVAASAEFNNTGGAWGTVTLTGKVMSTVTTANRGTVTTGDNVSLNIAGEILHNNDGVAIYHGGNGTITVLDGGRVFAENPNADSGVIVIGSTVAGGQFINVAGGTVQNSAANGTAIWANIYSNASGTVNVSGGTVEATGNGGRAIRLPNAGTLNVTGGTVRVTGANARAIYATGRVPTVNVSGGRVEATTPTGTAIYAEGNPDANINSNFGYHSAINISGTAMVTSAGSYTVYTTTVLNLSAGLQTRVSGGTVQNTAASGGSAIYNNSQNAITVSGGTVQKTTAGGNAIYLAQRGSPMGPLNVTGGTISATTGIAIDIAGIRTVNISGGTVSATTGRAIRAATVGTVNVSGTATVTSANNTATPDADAGTVYLGGTATLTVSGGAVQNTDTSADARAILRNTGSGAVTITGGTVSTGSAAGRAVYIIGTGGGIQLGGDPAITGSLYRNSSGSLLTVSDSTPAFAPSSGRVYTLGLGVPLPASGGIVVTGGGNFAPNFTLPGWTLVASGGNLVRQ